MIDVNCIEKSQNITLNVKDILIDEASIRVCMKQDDQCNSIEIRDNIYDDLAEMLIIRLKRNLQKGSNYTISMHFLSKLNSLLQGFYRSNYLDGRTGEVK